MQTINGYEEQTGGNCGTYRRTDNNGYVSIHDGPPDAVLKVVNPITNEKQVIKDVSSCSTNSVVSSVLVPTLYVNKRTVYLAVSQRDEYNNICDVPDHIDITIEKYGTEIVTIAASDVSASYSNSKLYKKDIPDSHFSSSSDVLVNVIVKNTTTQLSTHTVTLKREIPSNPNLFNGTDTNIQKIYKGDTFQYQVPSPKASDGTSMTIKSFTFEYLLYTDRCEHVESDTSTSSSSTFYTELGQDDVDVASSSSGAEHRLYSRVGPTDSTTSDTGWIRLRSKVVCNPIHEACDCIKDIYYRVYDIDGDRFNQNPAMDDCSDGTTLRCLRLKVENYPDCSNCVIYSVSESLPLVHNGAMFNDTTVSLSGQKVTYTSVHNVVETVETVTHTLSYLSPPSPPPSPATQIVTEGSYTFTVHYHILTPP